MSDKNDDQHGHELQARFVNIMLYVQQLHGEESRTFVIHIDLDMLQEPSLGEVQKAEARGKQRINERLDAFMNAWRVLLGSIGKNKVLFKNHEGRFGLLPDERWSEENKQLLDTAERKMQILDNVVDASL